MDLLKGKSLGAMDLEYGSRLNGWLVHGQFTYRIQIGLLQMYRMLG
jgi:hypothetical protein